MQPDTLLAWHHRLIAPKFDGSQYRRVLGRPKIDEEIEGFVGCMAQENRSWGYDRIAGALQHLGYTISDQTVGNIFKRPGYSIRIGAQEDDVEGVHPRQGICWRRRSVCEC